LGRPSFPIVEKVLRNYKLPFVSRLNKDVVCDACQRAKSHQLPYPVSMSASTKPLELVFSDVWGAVPESVGRFKYYVSFINDYSKFTWVYLLRYKSEVLEKFKEFQSLVERLFYHKIIMVQSDWGGEYEKLCSFFTKIWTSHLVSCPRAHQQNGSAERKHRHIVEVGLSLLARVHMPLKYWDEAFLAATFLINHIPSKTINFETSLERLYHTKPDYGCACWPNLCPYNAHKLSLRSKECAFLGYRNKNKGFKCLDISSGRIYISQDVIFDENIFPFSRLHSNAGARLRSAILLPFSLRNPEDESVGDPVFNAENTNHFDEETGEKGAILDAGEQSSVCTAPGVDPPFLLRRSTLGSVSPAAPVRGSTLVPDAIAPPQPEAATMLSEPGGQASPAAVAGLHAPTTSAPGSATAGSSTPAAPRSSTRAAPTSESTTPSAAALSSSPRIAAAPTDATPTAQPRTRLQDGICKSKVYTDGHVRYGFFSSISEPRNVEEAMHSKVWREAMDAEFNALMKNKTWHLVPPVKGSNIVDCKWVYKEK
jgi:hypothetical protein